MSAKAAIIQVEHLSKKFGTSLAVDDMSFTVSSGEIVGFVGANGAGKTTTISTLLGFIAPSKGSIKLFDQVLTLPNAYSHHMRIGYAAGDMQLPERLSGRQYLEFLSHQYKLSEASRYDELCRRFKPQLDKKIGELSRGNKQKIALIGAFIADPELIILDEPTSGLDPVMQEVFLELIREAQARGKTVFMSSHYLNEVADVCSRVILMRGGRILQDISSKELLEKSGKLVKIVTGYKATRPPKEASEIEVESAAEQTTISFVFKGSASDLQRWAAGVKQIHDIEITEYNLEGAFRSLYTGEEASS